MDIRRVSAPYLASGALLCGVTMMGCDPLINIAGANFPAWLLCAIIGAILTAVIRPLLSLTGLEPHLGPLIVIYPCLAVLLSCAVYLLFFGRT
ncbi:MAG: YtcA family lipoprotein [Candidatus Binataceae bacterium]